jgi:tRNA-2-methylthio-N6-dimethylallyladenosine synthase
MNRRYTKEQYIALAEKIKAEIPGIAITTDIIVGFPGEGEAETADTVDVIKKIRFNGAFTFIYSKRTGTPAATMENQVDEEEAKKNFNTVLEALNPIIYELNCEKVGKTYRVLADGVSANDSNYITGRLEDNSLVHFKADESVIGNIINVKITDCKTFYLMGEVAE